ncbi:MAG: hypothetical protein ACLQME_11520 [Alphaproteobacteria bacterium]
MLARSERWRAFRAASRLRLVLALSCVFIFTLYWYGAFLSFPLLGEDAAALYSTLLETIREGHLATTRFPIEWLEGLGLPNLFVTFTFDPFAWPMLLPLDPADSFRASMALRATTSWLTSYVFVIVLFRGRRRLALASATLYLLINFILTSAWGIPTFAGIYNATHAALFPLLPTLATLIMRRPHRIGVADLGLLVAYLFFVLDYPVGSLIGTAVFLVYAGVALALVRPAERKAAKWGLAKVLIIVALVLLGPPLYILSSWSALVQDSARVVFAGELFSYGDYYQPPFMWTQAPVALRLCILLGILVLLFNRRWPRPLRTAAALIALVVGGNQLAALARSQGLDGGLVERLPRLHYFEFYLPLFYATCGGFALCHWQKLLHPRLDDRRHALAWAAGTVLCLLMASFILPLGVVFLGAYFLLVSFAFLRGESADAGRVRSSTLRRLLTLSLISGLVALSIGTWLPPSPEIHPVFASSMRCRSGAVWCRDPAGPTMDAAANPITRYLGGALNEGERFAGRAETLIRPPARVSLTVAGELRWTPELFARFHAWYARAYDAQVVKDPSADNPLRLAPEQVVWFGPGDSRDYLLYALARLAHSDVSFLGPMQEDLVLEMQKWFSEHGRSIGVAASDVTDGWETARAIEALVDERTNAYFTTGNGLVQRALPFQDVPVASAYEQSLGYLYYLLWTRYVSAGHAAAQSINITGLEALYPERLALLGVRYVVARDSKFYERPPLERVMGWHGYSVYALRDPNISGYRVSGIEFGDTLADELRLMRRHGFDPRRTAVLPASERGSFEGSAGRGAGTLQSSSVRLAPSELIFSAKSSEGQSLVVLPFNWSRCWRPEWRRGAGHLTRADVGLIGVAFAGDVELHLSWTAGYGRGRACLKEDAGLVSAAKQAASEVGFAEAYEPFDEHSPPFAVERLTFARDNDMVAEREAARRGDIEAAVPAYVAASLSQDERDGRSWSQAVDWRFTRSGEGYEFSGRNGGGASLVVLPLAYSYCWRAAWQGPAGELVPVDRDWLGVLFREAAALRLDFASEAPEAGCSRQDRIRQTVSDLLDQIGGRTAGGRYALGETVRFGIGGDAEAYMTSGWSGPEAWGRWSVGRTAQLVLRVDPPSSGDLQLDAVVGALIGGARQSVSATIAVNGVTVGEWHFAGGSGPAPRQVIVPRHLVSGTGDMVVEFTVDDPVSPAALGMSSDERELGLSFASLAVKAADKH